MCGDYLVLQSRPATVNCYRAVNANKATIADSLRLRQAHELLMTNSGIRYFLISYY